MFLMAVLPILLTGGVFDNSVYTHHFNGSEMKKILFLCITLAVTFVAVESMLRLSVLLIPENPLAHPKGITVQDPVLGHRIKPGVAGHDNKGFRNDSVYSRSDVVVLGDSQTYGSGVKREENWPSQLRETIGMPVYNMSVGGWGPVESMFLLDEALEFQPKLIIEALYSGNDFHDCFSAVYYRLQLDSLKTSDGPLAAAVDSAEQLEKFSSLVSRAHSIRRQEKREGTVYHLKNWLYANLYTYKVLSTGKNRLLASLSGNRPRSNESREKKLSATVQSPSALIEKQWSDSRSAAGLYPSHYLIFDSGIFRTILTPRYRLVATDQSDPRPREGVQLALGAIERMADKLRRRDISFLVLLIPTKELVYGELANETNTGNIPAREDYLKLLASETEIWLTVKQRLDSLGIAWLDGLPCLRESFATGVQPYMVTENGHPDTPGHRALAGCVSGWMSSHGITGPER